jgi:hypothetical protein
MTVPKSSSLSRDCDVEGGQAMPYQVGRRQNRQVLDVVFVDRGGVAALA